MHLCCYCVAVLDFKLTAFCEKDCRWPTRSDENSRLQECTKTDVGPHMETTEYKQMSRSAQKGV